MMPRVIPRRQEIQWTLLVNAQERIVRYRIEDGWVEFQVVLLPNGLENAFWMGELKFSVGELEEVLEHHRTSGSQGSPTPP